MLRSHGLFFGSQRTRVQILGIAIRVSVGLVERGRGSVIVALISRGLLSRDRQGAVSVNQNPQNG
jgi:hypothetical protein